MIIALKKWRASLPAEFATLEGASALLGVSAVQLSRYENGLRRIPAEKVRAFSVVTGIAPELLRADVFGPPQPIRQRVRAAQEQAG